MRASMPLTASGIAASALPAITMPALLMFSSTSACRTGDSEKIEEFLEVMRSYGEMEISRSGAVAMSLDEKKLRLQPPVPTRVDMVRM